MTTSVAETGPTVGTSAPDIVLPSFDCRAAGVPRVLAFSEQASLADEPVETIARLRAQLRGLGAELIVLSPTGVWSLAADDPAEQIAGGDTVALDVATAASWFGVRPGGDAVFVIDAAGIIRFAHRPEPPSRPLVATLVDALALAGQALHTRAANGTVQRVQFTRREWAVTCLVVGCATAFFANCKESDRQPQGRPAPAADAPSDIQITLSINGTRHALTIDPRASLLDTLRERLGLTGTKKGCDAGQCGACTVLVGGKRVTSCLTLAVMAQGKDITTIEGLARSSSLHPMQQAFIDHDGLQCGYCTPGQIMSAVGMLDEGHATSDAEVREQMSGNICRCGAYPNIVAAIQAARKLRG